MSSPKTTQPAQYLVDEQGHRTAIVIDIQLWEALMDLLEYLEDLQLVKSVLTRLQAGPEASGALEWDAVRDEL